MKTPRTISEAQKNGYIVKRAIGYRHSVNVIMEQRFFDRRKKTQLNFWITFLGAKRKGIQYY